MIVVVDGDSIVVNGMFIKVFVECDFVVFLWGELGVEFVIELIGCFIKLIDVCKYIEVGVKKVIIFVFVSGDDVVMFVFGVNEGIYDFVMYDIILNVFCIMNCFVLLVKVFFDEFGIECGLMIMVYVYIVD